MSAELAPEVATIKVEDDASVTSAAAAAVSNGSAQVGQDNASQSQDTPASETEVAAAAASTPSSGSTEQTHAQTDAQATTTLTPPSTSTSANSATSAPAAITPTPSPAGKKFTSLSVNKRFLEKATPSSTSQSVAASQAASAARASPTPRDAQTRLSATTSSRLTSAKLSTTAKPAAPSWGAPGAAPVSGSPTPGSPAGGVAKAASLAAAVTSSSTSSASPRLVTALEGRASSPRPGTAEGAPKGSPGLRNAVLGNSGRAGSPASAAAAASAASSKAAAPWALKSASTAAPQSHRATSALASHFPTAAEAQKAKAAAEEKERAAAAEAAARNAAVMQQLDRFRGTSLAAGRHWDEMEDEEDGGFLDEVVEFGDGTQYKVPATKEEEDQAPVSKEDRFKDQGHDRSWPPSRRDAAHAQQANALPHAQAQARPSPWARHAPHDAHAAADLAPGVASRSLFPARGARSGASAAAGPAYDDEATEPGSLQLLTRDRRGANSSGGEHGGRRGREGYVTAAAAPTTGANATVPPTSVRAWGPLAQRAASLNPEPPKPAPVLTPAPAAAAASAAAAAEVRPPPATQRASLPLPSKRASAANAAASDRALPPHLAAGYGASAAPAPTMTSSSRSRSPVAHTRAPWARASDTSPDAMRPGAPSVTVAVVAPAAAAVTPIADPQRSEMVAAAERARKRRQEEEEARLAEKERAKAKAAALEAVIKAKEAEQAARKAREEEEKKKEETLREEQSKRRVAQEERMASAQATHKQTQQQPRMPALQAKQQQQAAPAPVADERVWRRGPALPPQQQIAPTASAPAARAPARTLPAQPTPAIAAKSLPRPSLAPRSALSAVAQPAPAPSPSDEAISWRRAPAAPAAPIAALPTARKPVALPREPPRVVLQRAPDASTATSGPKAATVGAATQTSPTLAVPPTGPRAMRGEAPAAAVTQVAPMAPRVQIRPPRVEIIAPTDERGASLRSPASSTLQPVQQRKSPTSSSSPAGSASSPANVIRPEAATRPARPSAMKPARPAVPEPLTTRTELAPEAPPAWNRFVVRAPKTTLIPSGSKGRGGKATLRGGKRVVVVSPDGAADQVDAPPVQALSWEPPIPNLSMRTLSRDDQFFPKKFSKGKVITPVSVPKATLPRGLKPKLFERRPLHTQTQQHVAAGVKGYAELPSPKMKGAAGRKAKKSVAAEAQVVPEEPRKNERGAGKVNVQRVVAPPVGATVNDDAWRRVPSAPKHVAIDATALRQAPPSSSVFHDSMSNATPSGPLDDPSTASPIAHQRSSAQARPKDRRDSGSGVAFARSTHVGAALRGDSPVSFMVSSELDSVRSSVQTQTPALPSPGQMGGATWGQGPLATSFVLPASSSGGDASHLKSVWAPPDRSSAPGGGARPAQNSLKGIADDLLSMPLSMHDLSTGGEETSPTAASHGGIGRHADAARNNGFTHSSTTGAQSRNSNSSATTTSVAQPNASPGTAPTSELQALSPSMPNLGRLNLGGSSGGSAGGPHDRSRSTSSGFGPYAYGAPFGVSPAAAAYGSPAIRHQSQHVQHGVVPGYNGYGSSPAYEASFAAFRPPLLPQQRQRGLHQQPQQGEMSLMGASTGVWGDQNAYSPAVVALQQQHAYAVSNGGYGGMGLPVVSNATSGVRTAPGQGQRGFAAQQAYRSPSQQQHASPQSQSGMLQHVGAPHQHQHQHQLQEQPAHTQQQQQHAARTPSGAMHGAARPFAYPAYKPYDPAAGVW